MANTNTKAAARTLTPQDRIDWENKVYEAMSDLMDVTQSDAQGIAEAASDALERAWEQGATPHATAEMIDTASQVH